MPTCGVSTRELQATTPMLMATSAARSSVLRMSVSFALVRSSIP